MDDLLKNMGSTLSMLTLTSKTTEELEKQFDDTYHLMCEHMKARLCIILSLEIMMETDMITETDFRIAMNTIQDKVIQNAREKRDEKD